jgi:glycosyltransferase involved in cell wall biosynthesis
LNDTPLISVLIPARNEEKTLPVLLEGLISQEYSNIEIIIYNDQSSDNTEAILYNYAQKDKRIRYIKGDDVPVNWVGKNYACHRLSEYARGSYFLFLDADVIITPGLLTATLTYQISENLILLSVFPQQIMKSWGEKLTVPLMNWILISLLPLIMIKKSPRPSLAAANGQFMLFHAQQYQQFQFHKWCKNSPVEDIAISKKIKQMGYQTQTLLSNGSIRCRMYNSGREAISGFSKNVLAFFSNSIVLLFSFILLVCIIPLMMFLVMPWYIGISYICGALLIRILVSYLSKQALLQNCILLPLQLIAFIIIGLKGVQNKYSNKLFWKGRTITNSN